MVATNAALASGGITHCCLRCGLRMFFLASARSRCRWRARQCAVRRPSPRADAGSIWQSLPGPETNHDSGRSCTGRSERLSALAAELVGRHVPVIVSSALNATHAAKAATSTIPVVFAVNNDPVATGLVASLNRPGGNLTGAAYLGSELGPNRLGLIHEMVPKAPARAGLAHPAYPASVAFISDVKAGARTLGLRIEGFNAATESEIDAAFAALSARRLGALLIANHPLFTTRREQIIALAARHAVPTIYVEREFARSGGLISYGTDLPEVYRLTGGYAGRILRGDKPADLPVLLPTKFEMIINLRTAKMLGLEVPDKLIALADEVIE